MASSIGQETVFITGVFLVCFLTVCFCVTYIVVNNNNEIFDESVHVESNTSPSSPSMLTNIDDILSPYGESALV